MPRPSHPDLQELVARFGGYDKITEEAWAQHDAAMAAWMESLRYLHRDEEAAIEPADPNCPCCDGIGCPWCQSVRFGLPPRKLKEAAA
jgi:hypothetical protein